MAVDDALTSDRLAAALAERRTFEGAPWQLYPVAVSVDAVALGWLRQDDAPEGAVVVAETELSARGRREVAWVSAAGGTLAFAVVLRPALPPEAEGLLWLLASLAAAEGVSEASGVEVSLKWPNDLLAGDRRLGLVTVVAQLGPGRLESAVVTVRLNVGQSEHELPTTLRDAATSLAAQGAPVSRAEVLAAVLSRLEARYGGPLPELLDAYRARCATLGQPVRAELAPIGELRGRASDIDAAGHLVLDDNPDAAVPIDGLTRLVEIG